MNICITCGSRYNPKYVDIPCPTCGAQYKLRQPKSKIEIQGETEKVKELTTFLNIPKNYQNILWSKSTLLNCHKDSIHNGKFMTYLDQLDKIHNYFAQGLLPSKSAIICSNIGMSKQTLAYSAMQLALKAGHTVAPLLDTVDVHRLLALASTKPNYKIYNKFSFDDYIAADVCFVKVTHIEERWSAYLTILDLMEKRARLDKPTIFLSDYPLKEITRFDTNHILARVIDEQKGDDFKYPALLQYFEILKSKEVLKDEAQEEDN